MSMSLLMVLLSVWVVSAVILLSAPCVVKVPWCRACKRLMGIADIQSPVTAPVNINHYQLSPGVLAADVGRGAVIAVTVTGQRLNTGRYL